MRLRMAAGWITLACAASLAGAGELSGRRAPGFSLPDSSFRQYDLQDFRGKVVVLEIMQTNCPHCRDFAKVLEKVKQRYGDRVAVLAIVNPPDTQATVARYAAETGSTIPILFDCGQVAASYLKATPAKPSFHVPHVFLIDGEGMIRADFGYEPATKQIFEGTALFDEIDRLLGKPGPRKGR